MLQEVGEIALADQVAEVVARRRIAISATYGANRGDSLLVSGHDRGSLRKSLKHKCLAEASASPRVRSRDANSNHHRNWTKTMAIRIANKKLAVAAVVCFAVSGCTIVREPHLYPDNALASQTGVLQGRLVGH